MWTNPAQRRLIPVALATAALLLCAGAFGPERLQAQAPKPHPQAISMLTIGWPLDASDLDPAGKPQNLDLWIMANIYDGLVRFSTNGLSVTPDLATKWTVTRHGTQYTFHLRRNVRFSDGERLRASDVAFCLNRARGGAAGWSWTLATIKTVVAVNDRTVRVTLKRPWAPFLADLALPAAGIYPENYFRRVGTAYLASHPVGTGPYRLEAWSHNHYLRLVKNPLFWGAAHVLVPHVEWELVANDVTRLQDVAAGKLDVATAVPPALVPEAAKQRGTSLLASPADQTVYLLVNNRITPFNDARVRLAMSQAIDRGAIAKTVFSGQAPPANSFVPRGAAGYDSSLSVPARNLDLARKLMAQSSVPHGFTTVMEVGSGDTTANEIADMVKTELYPLHIKVDIRQIDQTVLFHRLQAGQFHLSISGWSNDLSDPDELMSFAVDDFQHAHAFFTGYQNTSLVRLAQQAEGFQSWGARRRAYLRIQKVWAQDQPFLALYYLPYLDIVNARLKGYGRTPLGYFTIQTVSAR